MCVGPKKYFVGSDWRDCILNEKGGGLVVCKEDKIRSYLSYALGTANSHL